jgi:hypothetical protein
MTAQPAAATAPPDRIPAQTIRHLRLFYSHDHPRLAELFQVAVRTIYRWEERGVLLSALPIQPGAIPPDWRRALLLWMLDRYEKTAVTDTRKKGESP